MKALLFFVVALGAIVGALVWSDFQRDLKGSEVREPIETVVNFVPTANFGMDSTIHVHLSAADRFGQHVTLHYDEAQWGEMIAQVEFAVAELERRRAEESLPAPTED